jgi:hypothetical protein
MSPGRLVRSGSPFDRRLLLAGRDEAPPAGAEEAALAALGLHAGAVATGATCGLQSVKTLGAKAGLVKFMLLAMVATCGAWAIGWAVAHPAAAVRGGVTVERPAASSPPAAPARPAAPAAAVPPKRVVPSTAFTARPPAVPPRSGNAIPAASSPAVTSDLSVETALVQRAAQALAGRDPTEAMRALDEYRERCTKRLLAQEAGLLRARALAALGRTSEAATLAAELRDADPQGILARRLEDVIDGGAPR